MANKFPKKNFETTQSAEDIVIEYLFNEPKQFRDIWNYLLEKGIKYDSKNSLVKILDKLENKKIIRKKIIKGKYPTYHLSNDSRLYLEARAVFFKTELNSKFAINYENIVKEIFNVTNNRIPEKNLDLRYTSTLVQYFGVYVLFMLITSIAITEITKSEQKGKRKINKEELRHIWLNRVLSLEEGLAASGVFYKMISELTYVDKNGKQVVSETSQPNDDALLTAAERILDSLGTLYPYPINLALETWKKNQDVMKSMKAMTENSGIDENLIKFIQLFRQPVQYDMIKTLSKNPKLRETLLNINS